MRPLFRGIAFASLLFTLGCLNGQAVGSSVTGTKNNNSAISIAALRPAGRVTDAAHVLSAQEQAILSEKLKNLEQKTQHQLVVVTVPSLGGRDVGDYARDLGNRWGIGRKGYDDGVVLLVAPKERVVRIAVGYGLGNRLPDETCQQVIVQEMLPSFRKGDIPGGIRAGTDALITRLE